VETKVPPLDGSVYLLPICPGGERIVFARSCGEVGLHGALGFNLNTVPHPRTVRSRTTPSCYLY
jgi:hypothetical protein